MHLLKRLPFRSVFFALLVSAAVSFMLPSQAFADDIAVDYNIKIFGAQDGLKSAEINAIVQTNDHYIWVGSYSGLYKYDGYNFTNVFHDHGIYNVMSLYCASDGSLWIGTNDSGAMRYVPETGEITSFSIDDGLPLASIRSFSEDSSGNIYLGGLNSLSRIDGAGSIDTVSSLEIPGYITGQCCLDNGVVVGVTNSGSAGYAIDGKAYVLNDLLNSGQLFSDVERCGANRALLVTYDGELLEVDFSKNKPSLVKRYSTDGLSEVNSITRQLDYYYICADNGVHYLDGNMDCHELDLGDFDFSVSDLLVDYQQNMWIISGTQGVAKLAETPFHNPLRGMDADGHVVNSVSKVGDNILLGCDDGIIALSSDGTKPVELPWTEQFDGLRIRNIYQDTSQNIWVSTYSNLGLVLLSPDGSVSRYTGEDEDGIGSRFRFVKEANDGTLYISSNNGLTILKPDEAAPDRIKTIRQADGFKIPQVLDLIETEDGSILLATDGGGIYVIRDSEIVGHIGRENGLNTQIVLKIIPCPDGYIYVTSNSLYYDDGKTIRALENFPYSNCYDAYISEGKQIWIMGSAGIFVVDVDDLISDRTGYPCILLNSYRGLDANLSANAWYYADSSENLYLCTSTGIRRISVPGFNVGTRSNNVSVYIESIVANGTEVEPDESGIYHIPAEARRVTVTPAILNYNLSIPSIRIRMKGFDDKGVTYRQMEQASVSFTNLPLGTYELDVQIMNEQDNTLLGEVSVPITQHEYFARTPLFHIIQMSIIILLISALIWFMMRSSHLKKMREQYTLLRIAKEETDRANEAKNLFLAKMSHEIRTPLNSIMGMNELILEESNSTLIRGYAHDIETSSNTLLSLIDEILDVTTLESDKLKLNDEVYCTADLIMEVHSLLKARCSVKGLDIRCEYDKKLPSRLIGDELHLKEVIMNLISNATKYTHEGSVTLRVRLLEDGEETVRIGVSVEDTGIGIPAADIGRIFDAFERIDSRRNAHIKGTGLGLYICKRILDMMHTELKVESTVGKGSTFSFEVQQKRASGEPLGDILNLLEAPASIEKKATLKYFNPGMRFLVVDDTSLNLKVAKNILKKTGAEVDTASNGNECLRLTKENSYDLIFLDDMMPDSSGFEVMQQIRLSGVDGSSPGANGNTAAEDNMQDSESEKINSSGTRIDTPIIVLTANALQGSREKYLSQGYDEYLSKPIKLDELDEILSKFLPDGGEK